MHLCVITVMVGVAAVWFTYFSPHLQARIIVVHVLLAILIGGGARAVFRRGGPPARRADGAMYAAKTEGHNRVRVAEGQMPQGMR